MASLEPGGTRGGIGLFVGGLALTALSMWFFDRPDHLAEIESRRSS